jgi:inosine/xanthosine triphosphatase
VTIVNTLTTPLVAVGSTNPVKIRSVAHVVRHWHPLARVEGIAVASGVSDQPWGDVETRRGARARARSAREALDADVGVGIEGGVLELDEELRTCAWAALELRDGRSWVGGSLSMPLPSQVAELVRAGMELGVAMDTVSGGVDTKRGTGAVGILTGGLVDRRRAYETIVAYAFAPLLGASYFSVPASRQR